MKLIFFLMCICCLSLYGCGGSGVYKELLNNIAEVRQFVMVGGDENIGVSLMCGKRESVYKIDGIATELVEFGVITVSTDVDVDAGVFTLFSGTQKYTGELIKNPFDGTLVADIKSVVDEKLNTSIVIGLGEKEYSFKLKSVGENWKYSTNDILEKFAKDYGDKIRTVYIDNKMQGEVYLKIMNDGGLSQDFYYLISMYGRSGEYIRVIYSPITGEILASNSNIA